MIDLEYRRETAVIRIRSTKSGVLDSELLDRLAAALAYIGPDRPIILTGDRDVFAPDLDPVAGLARTEGWKRLQCALNALRAHPCPIVAAINGDAIGAGYTLAEAADMRIMSGGIVRPSTRSGESFYAKAAAEAGLVELHCSPGNLLDLALRLAAHDRSRAALTR
ncbi:hypothetical protein DL991_32675 [Amycolatopsis sp. WAC 01375]|uniref:enoyl-CoA hydratase-related protein n=1 Tax=unclassified Amycolatopsis TaxID=2618356 RepID=UPI000F78ACDC|nr:MULTISPECIES: enoyl-CoA hydratase-related protein [unclassified Amycolatopsis]RSM72954.1 hypothetical protein DL991_32675 [Amycolatopsis sp. WAC 01375]RSN34653.1 hypothetical protein DL990_13525 [Amycolatopsis sp. WAC 01416]